MLMSRRTTGFAFSLWCLLLLWIFFGGLELAEQLHLVSETQECQDLDAEALSQLASGLKSVVPSLTAPGDTSVRIAVTEPAPSPSFTSAHRLKRLLLHDPPSLLLFQQLCVYRI